MEHKKENSLINETLSILQAVRQNYVPTLKAEEVGTVILFANGVVWVDGLAGVEMDEIVQFPGKVLGIVFDISERQIGVVLLDNPSELAAGAEVHRTGRVADVPVGWNLLGRVIDPSGRPLDSKGGLDEMQRAPLEKKAPRILDRAPVKVPLQTGIKVIDAMIPIGKGQRQLIIGDRQTGKTAIAIDAIIHQRGKNVICVYCAIGQRGASLAKSVAELTELQAMEYTVVIVAEGSDAPGMRYIAPYAATSIAEYFMDNGKDVLIVYDDLTKHANTYREISLLLQRPPGREAFPGDIFYIHSRLLERSTQLRPGLGGGSLTALPIIQTEAQNISAYIPTNLISITDGQLYLSPELFRKGILPAVDVGKSVSRIGGKAQLAAYHAIAGSLKLAYSQFEELELFSRFGTRIDEHTRNILRHGQRIRACLRQDRLRLLEFQEQIAVLLALTNGLFDKIPEARLEEAEQLVVAAAAAIPREILVKIADGKILGQLDITAILALFCTDLKKLEENHGAVDGDFTA